ncbi:unnamed protein product [Rotaria socialis]|uniref:GST N-terminal domain-containing protein n=1 Tax=Rotaria socialis TaxID=392032 RepID=A0A820VL63_9BILA|nr:unnamed protein product [Rotaria socialis]CAF4502124.1 unnamed protein product [Rotaria socialis]
MSTYKLYNFDGRGRAEISRLILVAAGQKFEDIRYEEKEWPSHKSEIPLGQVPIHPLSCSSISSEGSQTKASLDQFLVNGLSKYLHNIDILAKAYSESGKFFVGNHLNFADLCVYDALESIVEADTNILNEYA